MRVARISGIFSAHGSRFQENRHHHDPAFPRRRRTTETSPCPNPGAQSSTNPESSTKSVRLLPHLQTLSLGSRRLPPDQGRRPPAREPSRSCRQHRRERQPDSDHLHSSHPLALLARPPGPEYHLQRGDCSDGTHRHCVSLITASTVSCVTTVSRRRPPAAGDDGWPRRLHGSP